MQKTIHYLIVLALILSSGACLLDESENLERGDIINTTLINTYTPGEINQLWTNMGIPKILTPHHTVDAIRMVYQTIDGRGNPVQASGAFMVPVTDQSLPMLSLQHGTESKRNLVASESPLNSVEGVAGLYMGSLGYLICIPDYLGFGISTQMHPYCHAAANTPAIIDLIRAARRYCQENGISWNQELFLTGYSEGGYMTLATHKQIEQYHSDEFNLIAVAPMAGPYDLFGTARTVFQANQYVNLGYIGYLLTAYDAIYGWNRLADIFNPPYDTLMPELFNGHYTWDQITDQMPASFSALIKPDFRNNFLNGNETEVITALQENTLLNWSPQTPIRFYHGDADLVVPYQNALTAMNNLRNNGAVNISLVTIYGGNHGSSAPDCFLEMILWFDRFSSPDYSND